MKVLVVEDDYVVRQGIIYSLEWENYDLSICAQAANGDQGLKMTAAHRPDIIITDIRMPIMDGLVFATEIRKNYPETAIIILSGYDDFEYAKQAIKIGVNDYLLKPIDAEELLKCVCRIRDDLYEKARVKKIRTDRDGILKENQTDIRDHLLNKVVLSSFSENKNKYLEDLRIVGVELPGPKYKVLLLAMEDFLFLTQNDNEEEKNKILEQIRLAIDDVFFHGCKIESFLNRFFQYIIIMNYQSISRLYEEDCCVQLKKRILEESGFLCTFSCGTEKNSLSEIYLSYQEAVSALRSHVCKEESGILRFEEKMLKKEGAFLEVKDEENILIESLQKYDVETMNKCMETVFHKALAEREDYEKVKSTCIRLGVLIISNLEEMSALFEAKFPSPVQIIEKIQQCHTMEGLQRCMGWLLNEVSFALKNMEKEKYSTIIRRAVQYVEGNHQQEISVKSISAELYITPNYFSQIFKAQLGVNFTDYLNEYRIKKAKKLLSDLKLKVYEVAELSGYQNYKYFNKVFKRYTGYSPKEYRNAMESK